MYRLRSLYALLDGFHELENQEIYFAPYDELNDPLEGSVEMFWHGDAIVWKNLFRHYLLCLYYQFVMATIIGKDFCNEDFPIMISEFGSAEGIINIFQNIKKQFFAREAIQKLIQFLSSRVSNIKQQELTFWLKTIQCFAFSCVVSACNKAGLYENNSILSLLSKFDELDRYSEILDITPPDVDDSEVVFQYFNQGIDQTTTLLKLKAEEARNYESNKVSSAYFIFDFPDIYMKHIYELVYPKWYVACFMSNCTNIASWSHYADSHKGVCLIFKTIDSESVPTLPIERPVGIRAGEIYNKFVNMPLEKIIYTNTTYEVDFFRSLFNLIGIVAETEWYTSDSGKRSACADALDTLDNGGRAAYWEQFRQSQTAKTMDWASEEECRLLLDASFWDFSEINSRKLRYDFTNLEGIIFGTRTPEEAKIKISRIILEKCKQIKRTDFKFYQARYDKGQKGLVFDRLQSYENF